jgi:hypothetical protein
VKIVSVIGVDYHNLALHPVFLWNQFFHHLHDYLSITCYKICLGQRSYSAVYWALTFCGVQFRRARRGVGRKRVSSYKPTKGSTSNTQATPSIAFIRGTEEEIAGLSFLYSPSLFHCFMFHFYFSDLLTPWFSLHLNLPIRHEMEGEGLCDESLVINPQLVASFTSIFGYPSLNPRIHGALLVDASTLSAS